MTTEKGSLSDFLVFNWRISAVHMITYFVAGILAVQIMDYENLFQYGGLETYMRPTNDPIVALGPIFQCIRGLIFGVVLWSFRGIFLTTSRGWIKLWGLFIGLGILSTFGPSPGSVDGVIYTQIPFSIQLRALPELIFQSLLLSAGICGWYAKPWKGLNVVAVVLLAMIVILGIAGYQFLQLEMD